MASLSIDLKTRAMSNQIFSGSQNLMGAASSLNTAYESYNQFGATPKFITITSKMLSETEGKIVEDAIIPPEETFTKKFLISSSTGPFTKGYIYLFNTSVNTTVVNPALPNILFGLPIYITTNPAECSRQFGQAASATGPKWSTFLEANPNTLNDIPNKLPTALTLNNSYNIKQSSLGNFILGSFGFELQEKKEEEEKLPEGPQYVPQPFPFGFRTGSERNTPDQYIYTESIYLSYENNKSYVNFIFKNPSGTGGGSLVDQTELEPAPGAKFLVFLTV
jgi:hypothetical protein